METPLVSIISINFNTTAVTLELLTSLKKATYTNFEVIIVDNASNENPEQLINSHYPAVKFVRSNVNLGFSGGNNLGLKHANGEYMLFLNNDTEVAPNFLEPMVGLLLRDPSIGIVSPKIIFFNSGNKIQYVGCSNVNPYTGRNKRIGFLEIDKGQYTGARPTDLIHGAAMMIPRKVIEKVGNMPELFFLYYEEIDWCESIKRNGYKAYVEADAIVYHKESQSTGKNSPLKTFYMTRNRLLYLRRNTRGLKKLSWIAFFSLVSIPKNLIAHLLNQDFQLAKSFLNGVFWNLSHPSK